MRNTFVECVDEGELDSQAVNEPTSDKSKTLDPSTSKSTVYVEKKRNTSLMGLLIASQKSEDVEDNNSDSDAESRATKEVVNITSLAFLLSVNSLKCYR